MSARPGVAQASHRPIRFAAESGWKRQAACIGTDPAMWDDEPGRRDEATILAAREICDNCPVLDECRAYALATGEPAGIWGGLTEPERAVIRKRAQRRRKGGRILVPCGTEAAYHRHIRRKEPVDQACQDAAAAAQRKRYARRQRAHA